MEIHQLTVEQALALALDRVTPGQRMARPGFAIVAVVIISGFTG
jgi:hypothetical protein